MIGELLAETRRLHGDKQADLADKLGVTVSAVRSWEQEKSSPSHVSADFLLGLTRIERLEEFTREELAQIREFEEFLKWKKVNRQKR